MSDLRIDLVWAIREVVGHASIQSHDTSAEELLSDIADRLAPTPSAPEESGGLRLEGQSGPPHYATHPPEPGWFDEGYGRVVEVRIEDGVPWLRQRWGDNAHWGTWRRMTPEAPR